MDKARGVYRRVFFTQDPLCVALSSYISISLYRHLDIISGSYIYRIDIEMSLK